MQPKCFFQDQISALVRYRHFILILRGTFFEISRQNLKTKKIYFVLSYWGRRETNIEETEEKNGRIILNVKKSGIHFDIDRYLSVFILL